MDTNNSTNVNHKRLFCLDNNMEMIKKTLTPKSMPPTNDEHEKLKA